MAKIRVLGFFGRRTPRPILRVDPDYIDLAFDVHRCAFRNACDW